MILRTIYSIRHTWQNRAQLKKFLTDPTLHLANICSINAEYLHSAGVQVFVLDYDGVLAAHGEPRPRPEVEAWLKHLCQSFPAQQVYILSNKPTKERQEYFKQNFPAMHFVIAKRKKPYPDGLEQIAQVSGIAPANIMLVDDRLCTGILATLLAGVQGRLITRPYINFRHRPFAETGFVLLRFLEQRIVTLLGGTPIALTVKSK